LVADRGAAVRGRGRSRSGTRASPTRSARAKPAEVEPGRGARAKPAAVRGTLAHGDAFAVDGLRLGMRPNGVEQFKGSMAEFRVRRGGAAITHLPFEVVSRTPFARG
ncbi:hypothetical protein ACFV4N_28375, partial [Actinosynnema sp. NPDC059797]